jgi:regulator of protease activity HflC (stomatin/prohibitin superfamily)
MSDASQPDRPTPKKPLFGGNILPPGIKPPTGPGFTMSDFNRGKMLGFGALVLGAYLAANSYFTVDPAERAMVRFLGKVTGEKPLGPGLHFKSPLFASVDRAQVSLTNLHIPVFSVNTIDNQKIDLDINVSYLVPESAVYHLLYEVGRSGDADIRENVVPVVQDRISRIFSTKNTNNISEQREGIQVETTNAVQKALKDLFKIDLQSLQIAKIIYSPAFIQSNERSGEERGHRRGEPRQGCRVPGQAEGNGGGRRSTAVAGPRFGRGGCLAVSGAG